MDPEDSTDGAPSTPPTDGAPSTPPTDETPPSGGDESTSPSADDESTAPTAADGDGSGRPTAADDGTGGTDGDPFVYGSVIDDAIDATRDAGGDGARYGRPEAARAVGAHAETFRYVLLVTALALAARLVGLGTRIFHWDEGRVGYWILRYHETGAFSYRPIIHGPFLPIVNDYLFAVAPVTDFTARLPVALVGGLLPLAAWLFREHLHDEEVVALALLFAANPLLVYYSRFMRNDVLVAAFSVAALGFAVRAYDTRDLGHLFPAAAALGLAFTTKENALLYLLCFAGAGVLVLDHRLVRATARGRSVRGVLFSDWPLGVADRVRDHGDSLSGGLLTVFGYLVVSTAVFFAVVVFFYAPRPDLWTALGDPGAWAGLFESATVGPAERFYDTWATGSHQSHDYLPYLHDLLETAVYGAPVVLAFGVVGVVVDRYLGRRGFRGLVAFATYWGLASVVGYPLATDIEAPWAAIHAVVPLAIPAAVGIGFVYRSLARAADREDAVSVVLAAVLLLAAATGTVAANAAYVDSTEEADKAVLQWAQPSTDLKTALDDVRAVAAHNDGTDVLFYGTTKPGNPDNELFYVEDESSLQSPPPGGPAWHSRLPLPWYLERYGATVNSTPPDYGAARAAENAPPVVVAYSWDREELAAELDGYTVREYRFKIWGENVVVFVDESSLEAAYQARGA